MAVNSSPNLRYFTGLLKIDNLAAPTPTSFNLAVDADLTAQLTSAYNNIIGNVDDNEGRLWVVATYHHAVVWGSFSPSRGLNMAQIISVAYLEELRLFGLAGEFYLWADDKGFSSRLRLDQATTPQFAGNISGDLIEREREGFNPVQVATKPNAYDEWRLLWGTQFEPKQGGTRVFEERGASLLLPHIVTKEQLPIRLLTRQYLEYDAISGLVRHIDLRLVELRDTDLGKLKL